MRQPPMLRSDIVPDIFTAPLMGRTITGQFTAWRGCARRSGPFVRSTGRSFRAVISLPGASVPAVSRLIPWPCRSWLQSFAPLDPVVLIQVAGCAQRLVVQAYAAGHFG